MTYCARDDIFILSGSVPQTWVLANVFAKTFLGVSNDALLAWQKFASGDEVTEEVAIYNIYHFASERGLLEDPTRLTRETWPAAQTLSAERFRSKLIELALLSESKESYLARFAAKQSLLDFEHFGSFHEQIGQHIITKKRASPEAWWISQKFEEDLMHVRENLYRSVQFSRLESYFPARMARGSSVLDLGCGIGFYANLMAKTGAAVSAIDPSEKYIELAKDRYSQAVSYSVKKIPEELQQIGSAMFDFIFISDALLYYFYPVDKSQLPNLDLLLSEVRRILKPSGTLILVEPHPVFYQQPWLGSATRPWTIIAEYRRKDFGVVPTLEQLFSALTKARFAIVKYEELRPDDKYPISNTRAMTFADQFPLWHLIEAVPYGA